VRSRPGERARQEEDRRRADEEALVRAHQQVREEHLAQAAAEQARNWRLAAELRAYAEALRAGEDEAKNWPEWIRQHADRIDPLGAPQGMPPERAATYEELQRCLPRAW
jgi:hypothetical protein